MEEDQIESLKEEIDLEAILKEKESEISALKEQIKRMQADFENYKKRQEKYLEEFRCYAKEGLICNLLPLIDNLERAISSAEDKKNWGSHVEGLNLILRQIKEILNKEGLEEIKACGEIFDPYYHECIAKIDSLEHPDETILEEFQKGYKLKDKILRPALVKVAKIQENIENKKEE
ncbi:MAG: nucleotide exchange factor GrpE [Armatimonadetes bacterium]|nr:nucleotide exchange factor GrpE [Armatimonadota bacterium]